MTIHPYFTSVLYICTIHLCYTDRPQDDYTSILYIYIIHLYYTSVPYIYAIRTGHQVTIHPLTDTTPLASLSLLLFNIFLFRNNHHLKSLEQRVLRQRSSEVLNHRMFSPWKLSGNRFNLGNLYYRTNFQE